jgi:hypothetical protein
MELLTTLSVDPVHKDSAARYLASLKSKLVNEKAAQKEAKGEVQTLARACADLKKMADKFAAQVPKLEQKVLDGLTELHIKELSLEQTTKASEEHKSENARLTKKLSESSPLPHVSCIFLLNICILLIPIQIIESDAELNNWKRMVKKVVLFFYPKEPSSDARTPQLLDGLPNRFREVILANMKQTSCLTLRILKSLYPRADLDTAGEGFAVTSASEEALKLVEDSTLTADRIVTWSR